MQEDNQESGATETGADDAQESVTETKKPQILVTGAGGALARRVINRLRDDYRIVAVDFRKRVEISEDVPSYRVDFNKRSFEDIFRAHEFDGLIHLGRIAAHEWHRAGRYNANVMGTQRLYDLAEKYGVKQTVVMSTYHVYGAHPYNPALLDEEAPLKASNLTMDLVDTVELENLSTVYMYKHPSLNITILRPCNVVGPGVRNSIGMLLSRPFAPVLAGFSPMMQFLHIEDMADAICVAYRENKPDIYNVAPDDWCSYQEALSQCGCRRILVPSIPPNLPVAISSVVGWKGFPSYLLNYFKYSVIIDGSKFRETFDWQPRHNMTEIFQHYLRKKEKLAAA